MFKAYRLCTCCLDQEARSRLGFYFEKVQSVTTPHAAFINVNNPLQIFYKKFFWYKSVNSFIDKNATNLNNIINVEGFDVYIITWGTW